MSVCYRKLPATLLLVNVRGRNNLNIPHPHHIAMRHYHHAYALYYGAASEYITVIQTLVSGKKSQKFFENIEV